MVYFATCPCTIKSCYHYVYQQCKAKDPQSTHKPHNFFLLRDQSVHCCHDLLLRMPEIRENGESSPRRAMLYFQMPSNRTVRKIQFQQYKQYDYFFLGVCLHNKVYLPFHSHSLPPNCSINRPYKLAPLVPWGGYVLPYLEAILKKAPIKQEGRECV